MDLFDGCVQATSAKAARDASAQRSRRAAIAANRAAKNLTNFLFHAAAVPLRTSPQTHLHGILHVPHDELSHTQLIS
jgi:hypothetical protein